jgi:DnaK suppressor protein
MVPDLQALAGMTHQDLRRRLMARRDELRELWRENLRQEGALVVERESDWEDLATLHGAADLLEILGEREVSELREIVRAVDKIDAGVYGRCEECGEPIAQGRILALPYARHCVRCAGELEAEAADSRAAGWSESGPER